MLRRNKSNASQKLKKNQARKTFIISNRLNSLFLNSTFFINFNNLAKRNEIILGLGTPDTRKIYYKR